MGVAYSNLESTFVDVIDATTPASFLAQLHTVFTGLGWDSVPFENGHRYLLSNVGQGLSAQVRIWHKDSDDLTYPNTYAFQLTSSYGTPLLGHVHHIQVASMALSRPFSHYWVWANECQLFIAEPGRTQTGEHPRSVCGGVPYALDQIAAGSGCQAQSPNPSGATSELWWSAGDDAGNGWNGGTVESFRTGHFNRRYSLCRNASVHSPTFEDESAALMLAIMRPAGYNSFVRWGGWSNGFRYYDSPPIASDSILIHQGEMIAQLFDSCLLSAPMLLEQTEIIKETGANTDGSDRITHWINHTKNDTNYAPGLWDPRDDGRLYSLLLLDGALTRGKLANVAY